MLKKSVLFILILGSIHMFGASLSKDDAEMINDIMGPHYSVLVTEGKEAFVEKVCSTWLKEQVRPEHLLDVLQPKVCQQAHALGFADHWLVKDMDTYVAELCKRHGKDSTITLLVSFMDYMALSCAHINNADEEKELVFFKVWSGAEVFGGAQEDFWSKLEGQDNNLCADVGMNVFYSSYLQRSDVIVRFCERGCLPMAEILALYSRGLIPLALADSGPIELLGIKSMYRRIHRLGVGSREVGKRIELIEKYKHMADAGLGRAWSDVMQARGVRQQLSVFVYYQMFYGGCLQILYEYPYLQQWIFSHHKDYVRYFQKQGLLDADDALAEQQVLDSVKQLAVEISS